MKAILEFDLDDADDRMAHLRCIKSTDMAIVLWKILTNMEESVTYEVNNSKADSEPSDGVYAAFCKIREVCHENGINIDDLLC